MSSSPRERAPTLEPIFISVNELCRLLGIGRSKAYDLLNAGLIDSRVHDGRRFVNLTSAREFAERLPAYRD